MNGVCRATTISANEYRAPVPPSFSHEVCESIDGAPILRRQKFAELRGGFGRTKHFLGRNAFAHWALMSVWRVKLLATTWANRAAPRADRVDVVTASCATRQPRFRLAERFALRSPGLRSRPGWGRSEHALTPDRLETENLRQSAHLRAWPLPVRLSRQARGRSARSLESVF